VATRACHVDHPPALADLEHQGVDGSGRKQEDTTTVLDITRADADATGTYG
jgi:hypothetical protein